MRKSLRLTAFLCAAAVTSSVLLTGCGGGKETNSAGVLDGEVTGDITVACYDSMEYKAFLEEAAQRFEARYPGTKVNIEAAGSMPEIKTTETDEGTIAVMSDSGGSEKEQEDYINKTNTQLMSGAGAETLAMDVLPYYQYAESGVLEDLNPYMQADKDFNMADYRENILKATQYKGGQYILPLDYTFDYWVYDAAMLDDAEKTKLQSSKAFSYKELIDIAKNTFSKRDENTRMFNLTASPEEIQTGGNLFSNMFDLDYTSYIDIAQKKVRLDDGRFAGLLQSIEEYAGKGYVKKSNLKSDASPQEIKKSFQEEANKTYYYNALENFNLMFHFNRGTGTELVMSDQGALNGSSQETIAGLPTGSEGSKVFQYNQAYGLSANSANKRTAWEFLKFLLGEEMQNSQQLSITGLPIRNDARENKASMMFAGAYAPAEMWFGEEQDGQGGLSEGAADGNSAADENGAADGNSAAVGNSSGGDNTGAADGDPGGQTENPYSIAPNKGKESMTAAQKEALAQYTAACEDLSDQLNTYVMRDTKIDAMIQAEVKSFFSGAKSAEEAAKTLQSKIELYLNES